MGSQPLHPANAIGYAHAFALPLPSSLPPPFASGRATGVHQATFRLR